MTTRFIRKATVNYSPAQMYELVNAIEHYPAFVPWCVNTEVLTASPDEVEASIFFAKGLIHQAFTTRNRLMPHDRIEMQLLNGPFRHLQGVWAFESIADIGSRVTLEITFEFDNPMLVFTLGPFIQKMSDQLVEVFIKRAKVVYGS